MAYNYLALPQRTEILKLVMAVLLLFLLLKLFLIQCVPLFSLTYTQLDYLVSKCYMSGAKGRKQ